MINTTLTKLFLNRSGLPIYFATTIYSFEGIGCILPIENQMKEPQKMVAKFGTINIAMGLVTCIYIVIGFFGYWHFSYLPPEEIEGSITLNLPTMDW
jgi:proton-coupled amino acid transporter